MGTVGLGKWVPLKVLMSLMTMVNLIVRMFGLLILYDACCEDSMQYVPGPFSREDTYIRRLCSLHNSCYFIFMNQIFLFLFL